MVTIFRSIINSVSVCKCVCSICVGGYSKFDYAWENTATSPGEIAVAFYSGIYSYAGWNYLNFMTEELKNPYE